MTEELEAHLRGQIDSSETFFWHRLRWRVVREYLPQDRQFQLIDVGAGAGIVGAYLQQDFPLATYRYVEPIDSLRHHLISRFGSPSDASGDLDYRAAQYVCLLDVLEHQDDDRRFIRQVVTRMAPGSTLLVTVPALPRLWSGWDRALGHERRYDRQSLAACIDGLPLDVQELSFLFPELVPLAFLRRHLRPPDGQPDAASATVYAGFPALPRRVNGMLYRVGSLLLALRTKWRTGTSLFLAATITDYPLAPDAAIG